MNDHIIRQKNSELKVMLRDRDKARKSGRHNWGDFNRDNHIKSLRQEIQKLLKNNSAALETGLKKC